MRVSSKHDRHYHCRKSSCYCLQETLNKNQPVDVPARGEGWGRSLDLHLRSQQIPYLCPSPQLQVIIPGESGFGRSWSIQGVGRTEEKPSCDNSHGSLKVA